MKKTLVGSLLLFALAWPALAFDPVVTEVSKPYEVFPLEHKYGPGVEQILLGELIDYPVMYEVSGESSFDLSAQIWQKYHSGKDPVKFSLIAVKVDERGGGVTEVARLNPTPEDWRVVKDSKLGMTFWVSPKLSKEVEKGVYRVEISTPENKGQYMLYVGDEDLSEYKGYFEILSDIRMVQSNFGNSIFKMLLSSFVYKPLGIILLLLIIYKTWRLRKFISHGVD